ncbi:flagellar basal body L-ring protein FlgH [Caulobacter radicis]|uniref:Flagellar biosynthesis protein FlgH n=1 Tax=Caulobacter radicis TaxID=2172650 RepID=A0A2T9JGN1_9CAUL|nr:flagellar basal body L-ring protein FlgH [Caulobacter radicis]PVM82853.1 flagellar biosynthesis protein FlgH [Caulobacter radicis]PVM84410.1 flagellar biosynthesis protein FlgH [Caulobacter radicis]
MSVVPTATRAAVAALAVAITPIGPALASDLYKPSNWSAMASDRQAEQVGDTLTVVIYESSSATNSAQTGSRKNHRVSGDARSGSTGGKSAQLNLGGEYEGSGQTGRSGKLLAQISVTVDAVLPNGDLHVAGEQVLNINGDRTFIRLKGRARRNDISRDNAIVSSRLADVMIDYDGSGFVARSGKPGAAARIFNWLGLL